MARRVVLPYHGPALSSAVTVKTFFNAMEAQLYANELAAHGIDYFLANQNANTFLGWYSGFTQVELQVRRQDANRAVEVLARLQLLDPSDVEPEDDTDPQAPIPDPDGQGMLVTLAAYDNPRSVYDAAAILGAARIESFLPALVVRGDRPRGAGKRFVLRVREADLALAHEALAEPDRESADDADEPRCPRCGSWRVHALPRPWPGLIKFLFGGGAAGPRQVECLRCHHYWTTGP